MKKYLLKVKSCYRAVKAGRLAVDGISMRGKREKFLEFFDSKEVIDLNSRSKRQYKF